MKKKRKKVELKNAAHIGVAGEITNAKELI